MAVLECCHRGRPETTRDPALALVPFQSRHLDAAAQAVPGKQCLSVALAEAVRRVAYGKARTVNVIDESEYVADGTLSPLYRRSRCGSHPKLREASLPWARLTHPFLSSTS